MNTDVTACQSSTEKGAEPVSYGFTVKHSADSQFGLWRSMALEVADLLPLPSSYRRPSGIWPSFFCIILRLAHVSSLHVFIYFIFPFSHEWLFSARKQFVSNVSGGLWYHSFLDFISRLNEIWFQFIFWGNSNPTSSILFYDTSQHVLPNWFISECLGTDAQVDFTHKLIFSPIKVSSFVPPTFPPDHKNTQNIIK